jgi:tetratricopeptide (TPR) repeat protein
VRHLVPTSALAACLQLGSLALVILVCDNDVARAQPPAAAPAGPPRDPVAGEALFREGRRLLKAGDVANACKKLEESQRLDPAPGTLANLAECHEQLGRTASAWEHWRRFADVVPPGDPRRATALARSADLEKRLPRLSIELAPGAPPELHIERDLIPLGPASYKLALPLDPGPHAITVTSPGRAPRTYDVILAPGELRRLAVAAGPALATPAPAQAPAAVLLAPAASAPVSHTRRNTGLLLLATGGAALGAGAYFGVRALRARERAGDYCAKAEGAMGPPYCWDRAYKALSHDTTYSRLADVAFAAGGVATAVGAFLVLTRGAPANEGRAGGAGRAGATPVAVAVQPTTSGAEVQLAGRF